MTIDQDVEDKKLFAAALIRESDPFKAALSIFSSNTNRALRAASLWVKDQVVIDEIQRLKKDVGELNLLPSKSDLARDIWNKMQGSNYNGTIVPPMPDDYTKLAKLYAEVMGFIEKNPGNQNNVNLFIPKMMEVPVYETESDWENAAEKQQRELLNVSRTRH